jgi:hypothetical protein
VCWPAFDGQSPSSTGDPSCGVPLRDLLQRFRDFCGTAAAGATPDDGASSSSRASLHKSGCTMQLACCSAERRASPRA